MQEYTALSTNEDESHLPSVEISKQQSKVARRDFLTALGAVLLFASLVGLGAWYKTDKGFFEKHEDEDLPPIFPDCKSLENESCNLKIFKLT